MENVRSYSDTRMTRFKLLASAINPAKVFPTVWLLVLAATILVSAQTAYHQSVNTEEYAYKCDPFGYLQMAREIRRGASRLELPQFSLESPQTRQLIYFMRAQKVPLPLWDELVAPHAHHYFPKSDYVGVQYPPGTALTLAMFPEGRAVYGLNRTVTLFFFLTGIAALVIAFWRESWRSTSLIVLSIYLGLGVLGRIGDSSFSINAILVPLLMSCLLAIGALSFAKKNRTLLAFLAALGSGLCLGFATLVRLPTILLIPGFLVLLWPRAGRVGLKSLPVPLVLGVVLLGILPVLLCQRAITGAWYLSSYGKLDTAPPTLDGLNHNFWYYFGSGLGAEYNWALLYAFVGFSGFATLNYLARNSEISSRPGLSPKRLGLAALVLWLVPSVFFLTHRVVIPYYMVPAIFAAVAVIGFGSLCIETMSNNDSRGQSNRRSLWWLSLVLLIWPGITTANRAWSNRFSTTGPTQAVTHAPIVLPAELSDGHAWIWADMLTGSLWYYDNKPSFKIEFTNRQTRVLLFRFVFERGEQQYIIQDSERMQPFLDEIVHLGGKLEQRGAIEGAPYFLIQWPESGPSVTNIASKTSSN